MRILVASYHAVPGYSGGWATPLDLLQPEHEVSFAVALGAEGTYEMEGVRVTGLRRSLRVADPSSPPSNLPGRMAKKLSELAFGRMIAREFSLLEPGFVLCLDVLTARQCIARGIPYALRLHTTPHGTPPEELRRVLGAALFATACPSTVIPGVEVLPHNVDLSRFSYVEHPSVTGAVMVSMLNSPRLPMLFVEGVLGSSISGTIVGDGPLRPEIEAACASSAGRLTCHGPVLRTDLPGLLGGFQIGVACYEEVPSIYQMKVPEYQAAGLYPLVMPWNHLAREAPELCGVFRTAEELSALLDRVTACWDSTLETRRKGREYALANYDVKPARARFREILEESCP